MPMRKANAAQRPKAPEIGQDLEHEGDDRHHRVGERAEDLRGQLLGSVLEVSHAESEQEA